MTTEEPTEKTPPLSQVQFAWASLGTVAALFLFLGAGNLQGVQVAALTMAGIRSVSWYYYEKWVDLAFAIAYMGLVATWQLLI